MSRAEYTNSSRARTDNRMNSEPQLYSIDLGTFRVAFLICYPGSAATRHPGHTLRQSRMSTPVQPYEM
jgi:hypothetical protein